MLNMIFLSHAERAQLKIQHRHESDGRLRDRIKGGTTVPIQNLTFSL